MIIKFLNRLFSDEVQYSGNHQDCVSPDVSARKANTVIVPDKFKEDIEALETYIGRKLETGLCIKVDLSELLSVIPRARKRTDAYKTLVQYLKDELGITLTINSKSRKEETMKDKKIRNGTSTKTIENGHYAKKEITDNEDLDKKRTYTRKST